MTTHGRAALVSYLSNRMEGPTFQNRGQLFVSFVRLNTLAPILNVHKANPERISKACPKIFCSKFFVVAFVSSWANLKTNLGSYTPSNLQLQAAVSSNINFLQGSSLYISTTVMWGRGGATLQNPHFLFRRREDDHMFLKLPE